MKQAIKDKHLDRMKKLMDALTTASHKLAEAIYRQTTQKGKMEEAARGAGSKEKVVDAEYEDTSGGR